MTDGSGRNFTDSLMYYDRATSSWKTSQGCLPLTGAQPFGASLPTLPSAGTMRNGTVFPQPPLVPRTSGTGSSLLPSPTAQSFWTQHAKDPCKTVMSLETMARRGLGPTPMAVDATKVGKLYTPEEHYRRQAEKKAANPNLNELHKPLITAVLERQMWPTPTAQDAKNNAGPSQWDRNSDPLNVAVQRWPTPTARLGDPRGPQGKRFLNPARSNDLDDAVDAVEKGMWPTPTTSDASGGGNRNSAGSKAHAGVSLTDACLTGDSSTPRSVVSGQLNPVWVEWLMGFPTGWTVSKPSVTPSSPRSPNGSDAD
jgi:hypothetical protein